MLDKGIDLMSSINIPKRNLTEHKYFFFHTVLWNIRIYQETYIWLKLKIVFVQNQILVNKVGALFLKKKGP